MEINSKFTKLLDKNKKFLNFWRLFLFCQFVMIEMKLINNWHKQHIDEGKNRYHIKSNRTHFGN